MAMAPRLRGYAATLGVTGLAAMVVALSIAAVSYASLPPLIGLGPKWVLWANVLIGAGVYVVGTVFTALPRAVFNYPSRVPERGTESKYAAARRFLLIANFALTIVVAAIGVYTVVATKFALLVWMSALMIFGSLGVAVWRSRR